MKGSRQTAGILLLAIAVVLAILAVATLIPYRVPAISDLGYYSLCPFAPWSTLMLLFGAGLSWALRRHVQSRL
jgi:hypothetical protein